MLIIMSARMACNAVFEYVNTSVCRPDLAPTARAVYIPTRSACRIEAPSESLTEIVSSANDTPATALPSRTEPSEKTTQSMALHLSMLRMPCCIVSMIQPTCLSLKARVRLRIVMPGGSHGHGFMTAL